MFIYFEGDAIDQEKIEKFLQESDEEAEVELSPNLSGSCAIHHA